MRSKTVRLMSVLALLVSLLGIGGEVYGQGRLVVESGVLFSELPRPLAVYLRYEAWNNFRKDRATVWPWGFKEGKAPTPRVMRKHDRKLKRYGGCGIHGYQFDPTNSRDLENLEGNLLTDWYQKKGCPWFIMYESVFAGEYIRDNDGRVNLDLEPNFLTLDAHFGQITELANEHPENYVVVEVEDEFGRKEKRYLVHGWNFNNFYGDLERWLDQLRDKYPVFITGGMILLDPPDPTEHPKQFSRKVAFLKAVDGVMHYTVYNRSFVGSYAEAALEAQRALLAWERAIDAFSPGTLLFGTFMPAFDDRLFPGRKNPPMIPASVDDVRAHLSSLLLLRLAGVTEGIVVVGNEPFEALAVFWNVKHVLPAFQGTGLLQLMCEEYFSWLDSDCWKRLPDGGG